MRRILLGTASVALAFGIIATPHEARAWWRGGFGIVGPGTIVGPPLIYAPPPPVYYSPAPVYLGPPPGRSCFAGAYVWSLDRPTPAGGGCSCPTNNGRSFGAAR